VIVIQGVKVIRETDTSDRHMTLECRFDLRSPRITAYDIHEWIHDTLRLAEEDITMIQVDGIKRRVFIKFTNENRMKEILEETDGNVCINMAQEKFRGLK